MKGIPWFRRWFGEEYLALYPHRDREEARKAVRLLVETIGESRESSVLDLACGAGRHLAALISAGFHATGLDLSSPLLSRAREVVPEAHLVQGDMRSLPFRDRSFQVVTNFFTSFGYFEEEDDDRQVLGEVRRVLRDGGCFVLDFLNAPRVRDSLQSDEIRRVNGVRVVQKRRLIEDGRFVEKRITLEGREGKPDQTFVERVRLYGPEELEEMLRDCRLDPRKLFGDYDGGPYGSETPRCIVMGRAS